MVQRFHVPRPSSQPSGSAKYLFIGTVEGLRRTGGAENKIGQLPNTSWYFRADAVEAPSRE